MADPGDPLWLAFAAPASDPEPLTWGQRAIWKAYTEFRPHTAWLNLCRVVPVPSRVPGDVDSVARAVLTLAERHRSLRTRIESRDGELWQVPHATGKLALRVRDASGDPAEAEAVKTAMGDIPYDYLEEWPLRATLLVHGGRVTHVALVFSHVAADFHAVEILVRELRLLLLRGHVSAPAGWQSTDLARRERDVARPRTDSAVAYWLDQYTHLPRSMFDEVAPPLTPRYRRALLTSRAAGAAMRVVAARHRVSTATVLLAAACAVVGAWTGHDRCAFFTMVNNRHQDGHHDAISKLNQLGLFAVDRSGADGLGELIPRVGSAALRAYRHAYYHPGLMDEALTRAGRPVGSGFEPWCYLNDVRLAADLDPPALTGREIRDAMRHTEVTWPETLDRFAWRFRLQILDAPGGVGLSVTADTACLPPERIERFLRDMEELLVREV